jgi:transcription antitermination factor NusG
MWWYRLRTLRGKEETVRQMLQEPGWASTVRKAVVPRRPEFRVTADERGRFCCRLRQQPLFPGWVFVGLRRPLGDADYHRLLGLAAVTGVDREPLVGEFVAKTLLNPYGGHPRIRLPFRRNQRLRLVAGPYAGFECQFKRVSDFRAPRLEVLVLAYGTLARQQVTVDQLAWPAEHLRRGGNLHGRIAVPDIMRTTF